MKKEQISTNQFLRENFARYRAKDVVLIKKLQKSSALTDSDIVELLSFWQSEKKPKQSLIDFLVLHEVLTSDVITELRGGQSFKFQNLDKFIKEESLTAVRNRLANRHDYQQSLDVFEESTSALSSQIAVKSSATTEISPLTRSGVPRPGMILGKCRLTNVIGKGTSSIVYKGHHETLKIPVAIKVFLPQNNSQAAVIRKQFGTEAQTLAKLNHRSIVRILDFEDGQHPYLVLEYVDGKSLENLIEERKQIDYQQASYYIYCVASGLLAAHENGIIHRDIKPANILVTKKNMAKLADLGIAHLTSTANWKDIEDSKAVNLLPGTPAYIAPELAFTQNSGDIRSDIYSLGATFYHAVTGQFPFAGDSAYMVIMKHVHDPLTPAHEIVNEIPLTLSTLIDKMMAKKPEDRFQSVEEMLPDLLTLFLGSGLYSVNNDFASTSDNASDQLYGTRTRVLINTARRLMASPRPNDKTESKDNSSG